MPATATYRAREFVQAARRSEPPRRTRSGSGTPASGSAALAAGKQKAAVVGLDNSTLLAQLVAKKKVLDPRRLFDRYDLYFDLVAHRLGGPGQGLRRLRGAEPELHPPTRTS